MQFERKNKDINQFSAPFKQLCLYIVLTSSRATYFRNFRTITDPPLTKRTVKRYIEAISPLLSYFDIIFKKDKIYTIAKDPRYDEVYLFIRNYSLEDNESFCNPDYNVWLTPARDIDKSNEKLVRLYRRAFIYFIYSDYFNYHYYYKYMTGLFPFMVYNEEKKPDPKHIMKKFARIGIKDLTIRTIERDIKEVNKACAVVKKYKIDTCEWWIDF